MPDRNVRFNVAQLLKGPIGARRQYDLYSEIQGLDSNIEPLSPIEGRVTLLRTNQGILVTGELRTVVRTVCRRCLEPCDITVQVPLEEEFYSISQPAGVAAGDLPAPEERDEALLIDERHTLDLTEVLRQQLLLAATGQDLCREDCIGLCPQCGGHLDSGECTCVGAAIDPRWASLQALLPTELK